MRANASTAGIIMRHEVMQRPPGLVINNAKGCGSEDVLFHAAAPTADRFNADFATVDGGTRTRKRSGIAPCSQAAMASAVSEAQREQ